MTIVERTTAYWMWCWVGVADLEGMDPKRWTSLFYAYRWRN